METASTLTDLPSSFSASHISRALKIKPMIYPPVGPIRCPKPPVKPEKTGSPAAPSKRYTRIASVPRFPPSMPTVMNTPKVCMVKGTAAGIDIHEQTAITAVNRAMRAISPVLSDLVFIVVFSIITLPLIISDSYADLAA